jgi:hypothetical protein
MGPKRPHAPAEETADTIEIDLADGEMFSRIETSRGDRIVDFNAMTQADRNVIASMLNGLAK